MILGLTIMPWEIIAGGLTLLTLFGFQMLVGYRKIHFKGPRHLKIHKTTAWTILAVALVHASLALTYVMGWTIL